LYKLDEVKACPHCNQKPDLDIMWDRKARLFHFCGIMKYAYNVTVPVTEHGRNFDSISTLIMGFNKLIEDWNDYAKITEHNILIGRGI
jgi:hypothetical protein